MHSTVCSPAGHVSAPAIVPHDPKTPPRTPIVELVGIVPSKAPFLLVSITDGRFHWSIESRPAELQSFSKFQAAAVTQCGIWIQHESQSESRPARRADDWSYAVTTAFARGKAAVA